MPSEEIKRAMDALRRELEKPNAGRKSLPNLIATLATKELKEDAIRTAFWFLIGEGEIEVDKDFGARLTVAA